MAVSNGAGNEQSDLEKRIIKQIEYYFGDMNLPRDKFLQEKIKEDDGWVTLDVMLNFNRLRSISDDKEVIAKALRKSKSGLMEVSEDSTKIRRNPEKSLPDNTKERKHDINARSVYVKGFPADSTLDTLLTYFKQFGKIDMIFMRRLNDKTTFKGSVFATFASMDEAKSFVEKESVQYGETDLIRMFREDYQNKKSEEAMKKKRKYTADEEEQMAQQKKADQEKKFEERITKGAVLFLKGLNEETCREDVKTFFSEFGTVAWVEHANGDDKALVRFQEAVAESVMEKAKTAGEGKIVINGAELIARVIEGDEEKEYWRKMFNDSADAKLRSKNKRLQNRKRKFGGRFGKHGDKRGHGGEAKKAKVSDDA